MSPGHRAYFIIMPFIGNILQWWHQQMKNNTILFILRFSYRLHGSIVLPGYIVLYQLSMCTYKAICNLYLHIYGREHTVP